MTIVAVDIDEPVCSLMETWLEEYNNDYNDNLQPDKIKSWYLHRYVKPECSYNIYDYLTVTDDYNIYESCKPTKGALEAIFALREYNFRVIFVTAFSYLNSGEKFNWLHRNGFEVEKEDYIECFDKSLILADYLIDDRLKNVYAFKNKGILFKRPWNSTGILKIEASDKLQPDYYSEYWNDIVNYITRTEGNK